MSASPLVDAVWALANTTFSTNKKHVHVEPDSPMFVWYILSAVVLVLLGGVFSGLTLGLMGLDPINLQVLSQAGTPEEQVQAPRVLRLLGMGRHLVLVVLLLCNTLVNTSLPVFLDSVIGGGWIAILGATGLELIFGEVIPQAVCNKYGLGIGATFSPFVRLLIYVLYPIAKPIAMFLDRMFGAHDEGVTYRKAELKAFVSLGVEDKLADDELDLLGSVLEFSNKTVSEVMTHMSDTYQLPANRIVDEELITEVLRKGHTRIPVYESARPQSFLGVMLLRALVGLDLSKRIEVGELVTQPLPQCPPDLSLVEAMNYYQTGRSHILLVSMHPGEARGAVGIVTLEDIVEELLGKEIIVCAHQVSRLRQDETDRYVDMQSRIPVVRPRVTAYSTGLLRIIEGRVHRRRALLASGNWASVAPVGILSASPAPPEGPLVDHQSNV